MSERIVITGSPCSGKTSIIRELMHRGLQTCPEAGSIFISEQLMLGRNIDEIVKNRLELEMGITNTAIKNEADLSDSGISFLDRSSIDCLAYAKYLGVKLPLEQEILRQRYYSTVFIPEHLTLLSDRLEKTTEDAYIIERHIEEIYKECDMRICRIPLMTIKDRAQYVLDHLKSDPALQEYLPLAKEVAPNAPTLSYQNILTYPITKEFSDEHDSLLRQKADEDGIARIVISGFILNDQNEILILKRSDTSKHAPSSLETPGGKQEKGETLRESLFREIHEETGITDLKKISLIGQCDIASSIAIWRGFTFCAYSQTSKVLLSPQEHSQANWKKISVKDFFNTTPLNSPAEFIFMRHLQKSLFN